MKKRERGKKLTLHRETLRLLEDVADGDLRQALGQLPRSTGLEVCPSDFCTNANFPC